MSGFCRLYPCSVPNIFLYLPSVFLINWYVDLEAWSDSGTLEIGHWTKGQETLLIQALAQLLSKRDSRQNWISLSLRYSICQVMMDTPLPSLQGCVDNQIRSCHFIPL